MTFIRNNMLDSPSIESIKDKSVIPGIAAGKFVILHVMRSPVSVNL